MLDAVLTGSLNCVGFDRLLVLEIEWSVIVVLFFTLGYVMGIRRKGGKR